MSAALAALALLVAALLPSTAPHRATAARVLGGSGVLALLPAAGVSGSGPFVLLAAGAAAVATPLPLVLAAAGAALVALRPEGPAPVGAAVAGLALAAAADGVQASWRARRAAGGEWGTPLLLVGALVVLVLATVDRGAVLGWRFGAGDGAAGEALPGVGPLLGVALLAGLAGVLTLGGTLLAPETSPARPVATVALWISAGLSLLGVGVGVVGAAPMFPNRAGSAALSLSLLVAASGALASLLWDSRDARPGDAAAEEARAALATRVATSLTLLAVAAAAAQGFWRDGTYRTPLALAAASAALLGLAALEPTRAPTARRAALLFGLVALAVG